MKVKCCISGLEFFSSPDFKDEPPIVDLHPIFRAPTRVLLSKARKYGKGVYPDREQKLLFLALLNCTNKVRWDVPANPSDATVKKNLEPLFHLVSWWHEVHSSTLRVPELAVTQYNSDLSNIAIYIQAWYDVRQEWMTGSSKRILQQLLETRESRMMRLIHSNRSREERSTLLASWALDACEVKGEDKKADWTALFKLRVDKDLMSCDLDELTDMRNWIRDKLYAPGALGHGYASVYAADVMGHLNDLVTARRGGYLGLLNREKGTLFDIQPNQPHEDDTEAFNKFFLQSKLDTLVREKEEIDRQLGSFPAPEKEPTKEAHNGNLASYLQAKLRWSKARQLQENLVGIDLQIEHTLLKLKELEQ